MNPTTKRHQKGINWRAVVQLALGVAAGIVAAVGTIAVAVTSFTLSFDAITAVAQAAHIRRSIAWMMPVSIDGAMLVATVTAVVMRRMGREARDTIYPWTVVLTGAVISIACNAAHATGSTTADGALALDLSDNTRMAISAIPAVMLALSVHLLIVLIDAFFSIATEGRSTRSGDAGAPDSAASIDRRADSTPARSSVAADTRSGEVSMSIDAQSGARSAPAAEAPDRRSEQDGSTRPALPQSTRSASSQSTRSGPSQSTRSASSQSTRSSRAKSTRSGAEVRSIHDSGHRSMDELRALVRQGIESGALDQHPKADPIRTYLRCSPVRARTLRDEFKSIVVDRPADRVDAPTDSGAAQGGADDDDRPRTAAAGGDA